MFGSILIYADNREYSIAFSTTVKAKAKEDYTAFERMKIFEEASRAIEENLRFMFGLSIPAYLAKLTFEESDYWLEIRCNGVHVVDCTRIN